MFRQLESDDFWGNGDEADAGANSVGGAYAVQLLSALMIVIKVTEKTFQEMYINVRMANCEKRPKEERDDIHFKLFCVILKCGSCWNVYDTGGVCYQWVLEASFRNV